MSSDRYHKAAKDGLLDVLKEATRREVNAKDVDGMTPVLWAAFEGRLEALRLLVGRGGDPDKSDQFGNTALHLSAAKGHLQCIDFLVKFGVNLYSLDIDRHSAKDLAAINNRDEILHYLDSATASLEQSDRKRAKTLKEQADKNCDKRIKEYTKRLQRMDMESDARSGMPNQRPSTVLSAFKHKLWSSQSNLKQATTASLHRDATPNNNTTKFSTLVGGGGTISSTRGAVQKKAHAEKLRQLQDNEFKVGEIEASGKRSVRSLHGYRRDSEVLYVGSFSSNGDVGKRGKIADVFEMDATSDTEQEQNMHQETYGTLSRSRSQPDFLAKIRDEDEDDNDEGRGTIMMHRPSGLFDRPLLGSLAFRRSVTAALSELQPDSSSITSSSVSMHKPKSIKPRSNLVISDSESEVSSDTEEQEDGSNPLERFLAAWGLAEHHHIFQKQEVDLETLMLLTEGDLKSLGLPLGPFRKLVNAIQERKSALTNPGAITDSKL